MFKKIIAEIARLYSKLTSRKLWVTIIAIYAAAEGWRIGAVAPDTAVWVIMAAAASYAGIEGIIDTARNFKKEVNDKIKEISK